MLHTLSIYQVWTASQAAKIEELTQLVEYLGQSRYETEQRSSMLEKRLKRRSMQLAVAEDELRRSEPSSPSSARSHGSYSSRISSRRQVRHLHVHDDTFPCGAACISAQAFQPCKEIILLSQALCHAKHLLAPQAQSLHL